ncbi:MAG TPA: hypothetical protein VMX58_01135 [Patescibacteria group bacterium]|nr:hypothetical protein [Patescibacteria group bacterium]
MKKILILVVLIAVVLVAVCGNASAVYFWCEYARYNWSAFGTLCMWELMSDFFDPISWLDEQQMR